VSAAQPLDRRVGYLLKRAQQALRSRIDEALADLDLTAPQYAVLANLEERSGMSNAELARRSFVTPQTMIRIVTGLEDRGLIVRAPRPDNRKVLEASLTRLGSELVELADLAVAPVERIVGQGFSDQEVTALAGQLAELAARLEETG
jgi:DNA-binding MarR family transcriptional regulator